MSTPSPPDPSTNPLSAAYAGAPSDMALVKAAVQGDRRSLEQLILTMGGGQLIQLRGRDLMTLEKRADRWWLLADHFSGAP